MKFFNLWALREMQGVWAYSEGVVKGESASFLLISVASVSSACCLAVSAQVMGNAWCAARASFAAKTRTLFRVLRRGFQKVPRTPSQRVRPLHAPYL